MKTEEYLEQIESLQIQIESKSDWAAPKQAVAALLESAFKYLKSNEFDRVLARAEVAFSKSCGNHEDLEKLEKILDPLHDMGVITPETYARIIENTSCNRWL